MRTAIQKTLEELFSSEKGIDEKIALKCGVNASTVYRWRKGKTTPHSIFVKIIDGFHAQMLERQTVRSK